MELLRPGEACYVPGDDVSDAATSLPVSGDQPRHPRLLRHLRPRHPQRPRPCKVSFFSLVRTRFEEITLRCKNLGTDQYSQVHFSSVMC